MKSAIKNANQTAFKLIGILSIVFVVAAFILPTYALANGDSNANSSLLGDINGDGQVNILDFTLLKLILLGQETPTDSADVDGNGIINTLDLDALLDQFFGKAAPHGGGGGGGGGAITNQVNFEFSTYQSSYGPGTTGHTFIARVKIAQTSFLYNGSFTVDYNSSILQVNNVSNGLFATTCVINMTNDSAVDWTDAGGQLTVFPNLSSCAINGSGISGSGYLCVILFETKSAGTSPLTLGNGSLYQSQSGNISAINGTTWINSSAQITQLYSLNITSSDHGDVTTPGEGTFNRSMGQQVSIAATASDSCWQFYRWEGNTDTIADVNASSTTITMNDDYSITANFSIRQYNLTLSAAPGAGGSPTGNGPYDCNVSATIHANINPCYTFNGWTGPAVTAGKVAAPSSPDTTVQMDGNYTVTANYIQTQYTLTVGTASNGTTNPSVGPHQYGCGNVVSILATPADCFRLDHWVSDNSSINNSASNPLNFNIYGNTAVTPYFVPSASYILSLTADPLEGGTPTANRTSPINCGLRVALSANASTCYNFSYWEVTSGSLVISTPNASSVTITMRDDYSITAHYTIKRYTLTTAVSPVGAGTVVPSTGPHDCNASVQVTANPTGLYVFDHWSGNLSGNTNPTSIIMNSSKSVTANFVIPPSVYCQNVGTRTAGTDFSLSINATNLAPAFRGGELLLKYNPSVITVNLIGNVSNGVVNSVSIPVDYWSLMGLDGQTPDQQGSVKVLLNLPGLSSASGSGYLCTISFHAVSSGTTSLEFFPPYNSQSGAQCKLNDISEPPSQLNITWVNGSVTIQ